MSKKILIPIILVVVLAVAAVLYFFVFTGEKPVVYTYFTPGDYFVTNVKDSNRLLKTVVVMVYDEKDKKLTELMAVNQSLIRDTVIFILRDLNEAAIKDQTTVENLRQIIRDRLNEVLGLSENQIEDPTAASGFRVEGSYIYDILFSDYVMQ